MYTQCDEMLACCILLQDDKGLLQNMGSSSAMYENKDRFEDDIPRQKEEALALYDNAAKVQQQAAVGGGGGGGLNAFDDALYDNAERSHPAGGAFNMRE